jgi:hypothetical protein
MIPLPGWIHVIGNGSAPFGGTFSFLIVGVVGEVSLNVFVAPSSENVDKGGHRKLFRHDRIFFAQNIVPEGNLFLIWTK